MNSYMIEGLSGADYGSDLFDNLCEEYEGNESRAQQQALDLLENETFLTAEGFDMEEGEDQCFVEDAIAYVENL